MEALDQYFRRQVTQDVRRRVTACYVAIEVSGSEVAGYYTLAAAGIPLTDMPADLAKRLPRYPSVPVARLGRLAVHQSYRGRKLGAFAVGRGPAFPAIGNRGGRAGRRRQGRRGIRLLPTSRLCNFRQPAPTARFALAESSHQVNARASRAFAGRGCRTTCRIGLSTSNEYGSRTMDEPLTLTSEDRAGTIDRWVPILLMNAIVIGMSAYVPPFRDSNRSLGIRCAVRDGSADSRGQRRRALGQCQGNLDHGLHQDRTSVV